MTTVYPTTTAPQPNGSGQTPKRPQRNYYITQQTIDALADPANAPIILHDAFNQRLAAGDPNAVAVKAAVDRWQALRDSAYRAYSVRAGVPVAPARFHDLCGRLATLYADPDANRAKITEILHILGI